MAKRENPNGCPMLALLEVLSGPWTLYLIWILRNNGPTRFGALKRMMTGISAKVLTERLRLLESTDIIYRQYEPTVPPQVTYGISERGKELMGILDQLREIADRWRLQDRKPLGDCEFPTVARPARQETTAVS